MRNILRRTMSSFLAPRSSRDPYVRVTISDPAFVKNKADYDEYIISDLLGTPKQKSPGSHVELNMNTELFNSLRNPNTRFLCPSPEGDEMLLSLGTLHPLSQYEYLGSHESDSGLTAIIRAYYYEHHKGESEELDWIELVTQSLENPNEVVNVESFPMLQFCAAIPEGDSMVAVYGKREAADSDIFDSIVLRAWCKVFSEEDYK